MVDLSAAVSAAKGLRNQINNLTKEPGSDQEKHSLTEGERREALAAREQVIPRYV